MTCNDCGSDTEGRPLCPPCTESSSRRALTAVSSADLDSLAVAAFTQARMRPIADAGLCAVLARVVPLLSDSVLTMFRREMGVALLSADRQTEHLREEAAAIRSAWKELARAVGAPRGG